MLGMAGRYKSVEMGTKANRPVSVANVITSLRAILVLVLLN